MYQTLSNTTTIDDGASFASSSSTTWLKRGLARFSSSSASTSTGSSSSGIPAQPQQKKKHGYKQDANFFMMSHGHALPDFASTPTATRASPSSAVRLGSAELNKFAATSLDASPKAVKDKTKHGYKKDAAFFMMSHGHAAPEFLPPGEGSTKPSSK